MSDFCELFQSVVETAEFDPDSFGSELLCSLLQKATFALETHIVDAMSSTNLAKDHETLKSAATSNNIFCWWQESTRWSLMAQCFVPTFSNMSRDTRLQYNYTDQYDHMETEFSPCVATTPALHIPSRCQNLLHIIQVLSDFPTLIQVCRLQICIAFQIARTM